MKDSLTAGEIIKGALALVSPFVGIALVGICCGCATKTRSVEIDGMFTQIEAGTLAIGSVDVMAAPVGEETATMKYSEDTAWLSSVFCNEPTKTHEIKVMLTGTNSVAKAERIVEHICKAFGYVVVQPTNVPPVRAEAPAVAAK